MSQAQLRQDLVLTSGVQVRSDFQHFALPNGRLGRRNESGGAGAGENLEGCMVLSRPRVRGPALEWRSFRRRITSKVNSSVAGFVHLATTIGFGIAGSPRRIPKPPPLAKRVSSLRQGRYGRTDPVYGGRREGGRNRQAQSPPKSDRSAGSRERNPRASVITSCRAARSTVLAGNAECRLTAS